MAERKINNLGRFALVAVATFGLRCSVSNSEISQPEIEAPQLPNIVCNNQPPGPDNLRCVVTTVENVCVSESHRDEFGVFSWSDGEASYYRLEPSDGCSVCGDGEACANATRIDGCCGLDPESVLEEKKETGEINYIK